MPEPETGEIILEWLEKGILYCEAEEDEELMMMGMPDSFDDDDSRSD